jgi:signal transduction histidine kinase
VLLLAGVVLLVRHLRRAPTLTRGRFFVLMIGLAVPCVANVITLAGVLDVDLTPLGFVVTAVALAFGMLRLHLLNIAPIARDALFDQMTDAILILDKQGQVVDFNVASRRMLQPQGGLGLPIQATLPKLTHAADWIDEARHSRFAMHEWLADANTVYDVRVSTLQDRNDAWVGYLFTLRDITAQKRAEDRIVMQNSELQKTNTDLALARTKAEESSRLKSEFLAVMSHELRTPLNAIMGFTELQMMGATGQLSDSQKDFLNRTLASSHELLELINNVIDLTRLEAERLPIRREPFETRGWWVKAIDIGHKQSAKKGLNFETEIDPNLPTILIGDAERLQQILMILLSNALKFTDEGAISVWMRSRDAQWWELGVQDTGIGVPTALQSAIFEAFRQVDSSSRRKYGGMGLGLALAQRLVQALGGRIEIESRENVGSTFRVILPMLAEPIIEQPSDN